MKIIGAGLSGLLAANMLRKHNPVIFEKQSFLPHNHTALLRHRENKIAEATSIPFKKVKVYKSVALIHGPNYYEIITTPNLKLANMYSFKVTGGYHDRSITKLDPVERFIAPQNFIPLLASGIEIKFEQDFKLTDNENPVISTIPMPVMAEMAHISFDFKFEFRKISVCVFDIVDIDCDIYHTVYFPELIIPVYRVSITGNRLIMEFTDDGKCDIGRSTDLIHGMNSVSLENYALAILENAFGVEIHHKNLKLVSTKQNKYGKIKDVPDSERKDFIKYLTDEYNIYSLGRYAIWKNILMDDVHKDVLVIQKLINSNGYFTG